MIERTEYAWYRRMPPTGMAPFSHREFGMNIHEYQAAEILKQYGIPINDGKVCESPAAAPDQGIGGGN
jgi:hypothetical protein